MRSIPIGVHAVLDLTYAAVTAGMPPTLGWSRRSTKLLSSVSAATLITSLLTRHPGGVVRLLPVKVHLIIDAILSLTLLGAQFLLTEEESEVRAALVGLGLFGGAVAALSACGLRRCRVQAQTHDGLQ